MCLHAAIAVVRHIDDEKMQVCCKISILHFTFESVGQEECPSLMWKYIEGKDGEKDHKINEYAVFLKLLGDLRGDIVSFKRGELTDST